MSKDAELLDLIIDRAPRLRSAGISSVNLESISFTLAPADAPIEVAADDEDEVDALHDPATFGRRKSVPGQRRPKDSAA